METKTLFENGNEYQITYTKVETETPGASHFHIDGKLYQVISKTQINEVTITEEAATMPLQKLKY